MSHSTRKTAKYTKQMAQRQKLAARGTTPERQKAAALAVVVSLIVLTGLALAYVLVALPLRAFGRRGVQAALTRYMRHWVAVLKAGAAE